MLNHSLLVAHIAVLGYWLGSELVINSTYRHVTWARDMPFAERDRLMDHVMNADQHVRYALLLQLVLGFGLLFLLAYLPGGPVAAWTCVALGACWWVLVEAAHRLRKTRRGRKLAALDRRLRYGVMIGLLVFSGGAMVNASGLPGWMAWKLAAFVGVMACGVGIRLVLIRYFAVWESMRAFGGDASTEEMLRLRYRQATGILVLLWFFIAVMVWLSVFKPA